MSDPQLTNTILTRILVTVSSPDHFARSHFVDRLRSTVGGVAVAAAKRRVVLTKDLESVISAWLDKFIVGNIELFASSEIRWIREKRWWG